MSESTPQSSDPSAQFIRDFLANRDVECPQCQYNLRDLQNNRCPECGEKLVVQVAFAEPKQGFLIGGLIGLSAGAGLNGLLLIFMVIQEIRQPAWNASEVYRFGGINGVGLIVEGVAIWFWFRRWSKIRRSSTAVRAILMFACWMLTLIDITVFSFTVK